MRWLLFLCFSWICISVFGADVRPNVLFIAVDDLKPTLGCYGDTVARTPSIDHLAANGTVFANNHCQQAVCAPSRCSLLTGLRPDSTKVWDLQTKFRDHVPDVITIPQHFRQNGYETAGMGKVFDYRSVDSDKEQDAPSWTQPYVMPKGTCGQNYADDALTQKARKARQDGLLKKDNRKEAGRELGLRPPVEALDVQDQTYDDGATTQVAITTMKKLAAEDKPFFLAVGFKKPHLPFVAPKRYWDLYDRDKFELASWQKPSVDGPDVAYHNSGELRSYSQIPVQGALDSDLQRELIHGYYACVSYIDAQVGMLLDALEANGLAESTIVVLWGDHGWHLGDHGLWCKHSNFEQATRSPLIIRAPGLQAGQTSSPTEFVDIFPTLCDLTGLDIPTGLQGTSLLPILKDSQATVKTYAVSQFPRGGKRNPIMGYSMRSTRYRYTVWLATDYRADKKQGHIMGRELYDYENDPMETRNLIDDPAYAKIQKQVETDFPKVIK